MVVLIRKTRRRIVGITGFILALFISAVIVRRTFADFDMQWVDRIGSGEPWYKIVTDTTGQFMAGVESGSDPGSIQISDDYGTHWKKADGDLPDADNQYWISVASSGDGQTLLAADAHGTIWVSHNRGVNWVESDSPQSYWISLSMTSDAEHAVAGGYGHVWVANSDLTHWTEDDPTANFSTAVAYSPDGGTLAATDASGYISVSTDYGATWNVTLPDEAANWNGVTAANNGIIAAISGYTDIELTADYGVSWVDTGFGADKDWTSIASNADGSTFIAGTLGPGPVYASINSGASWDTVPTVTGDAFFTVASNASGSFLAAAGYSDVWTLAAGPTVAPIYFDTDDALHAGEFTSIAHAGDVVDLIFTDLQTPLIGPTVVIAGHEPVTALNVFNNVWIAQTTMTADDANGVVPFTITAGNEDGTATTTVNEIGFTPELVLEGNTVQDDTTPPPSQPTPSVSTGGSSAMSPANLAKILAPGPATTAYLNSLGIPPAPTVQKTIAPNIPSPMPFVFTRDLEKGITGQDVRQLQQFLINQNSSPAALALAKNGLTNYFGLLTQAALIEYQKAKGIKPAVGYFGPVTRKYVQTQ